MKELIKIYYDEYGWVSDRYPYNLKRKSEDSFIEVDAITYEKTMVTDRYYAWKVVDGNLVEVRYEETPEKETLEAELYEIEMWLGANDWKVNKVVVGEWSNDDPRFTEYLSQRLIKRNRRDEILDFFK